MEELKGFVPVIIGLFVVVMIIAAVGNAVTWLMSNPLVLVLVLAAVGAGVYFWIKRHRARTMV